MERREMTRGVIHSAGFQIFKKRLDKYLSQTARVKRQPHALNPSDVKLKKKCGLASGVGVDWMTR